MTGKPKTLAPKLRFQAFEDREGWEERPFGELYAFKATNTLSRDKLNYNVGTIHNIHYGDIHTRFQTLFDIGRERVPFVADGSADSFGEGAFCAEGDLVFADASEDLNDVGKSVEVVSLRGKRVVSGTHTILATRRSAEIIIGFGGFLFRSERMRRQIRKIAQGSKVYEISPGRLSRISVCLPREENEQRKIAACLMSLDEAIAAERRILDALRAHRRGLMQRLFPREGEPRPRIRFPEFRDGPDWEEKPFGDLYAFKPTNTLSRDKLNYDVGTIRNIHYGDIHTRFQPLFDMSHERVPFITNGAARDFDVSAFCAEGDLVFADASENLDDVGKSIEVVKLHGERVVSGTHTILATRRDARLVSGFGGCLFRSERMRRQIRREAQGSKVYQISPARLASVAVCFPQEEEQRKIATCLMSLDESIAAEGRRVTALKAHQKGLMQQLFPSPEGA